MNTTIYSLRRRVAFVLIGIFMILPSVGISEVSPEYWNHGTWENVSASIPEYSHPQSDPGYYSREQAPSYHSPYSGAVYPPERYLAENSISSREEYGNFPSQWSGSRGLRRPVSRSMESHEPYARVSYSRANDPDSAQYHPSQGYPMSQESRGCCDSHVPGVHSVRCGSVVPITPGFPNYDRWKQQSATPWTWQFLPEGLIYPSYLAGVNESRLCGVWNYERNHGWMWDATAGGRIGLLRYGSKHGVLPEGFQADAEGSAQVRIDYEEELDVLAADFRVGFPITYGTKNTQYKLAYYHVSSHLGDEYMLRPGARDRINYVRDSIVFAVAHRPHRDVRIYAEAAWAFNTGERTEPWELQFGAEYSPIYPSNHYYGSPFFAINTQLYQELDFSGHLNVQIGWQWRGPSNHVFRTGLQYFCGASDQFEFHDIYESKIGFGVWADF